MNNILLEKYNYYIIPTAKGGFEVYKNGVTTATRVAQIGYRGDEGFQRAKAEIERRHQNDLRETA
jgi:hypothetical protein